MSTLPPTHSGHRALDLEEPLIFELGRPGARGIDLPEGPEVTPRLGGLERQRPIGLPDLSEPQVVRHYTRLSQKNYGIDSGLFPLGSCTMKHNPRLNERLARLPGLADLHPFQPQGTVQGALALIHTLAGWLTELTGMPAVAMTPAAGAHGELCGLMAIRACLEARGDARQVVLVPESAHGTNPATAALCGYQVESIPGTADGRVDVDALKRMLGPDVAALMITNPNTLGLFERDIIDISQAVHAAGGLVYMDGANLNALIGRVRVGDLGVDAMHINLHKTFSTPHGGGGPGAGPVVLSDTLAPFAPLPYVVKDGEAWRLIEHRHEADGHPFGRMKGYHGQFGVFVRALAYMMSLGADGLAQASGDAVLAANYLLARLKDHLSAPFPGPVMHEALFDDSFLKGTGASTLDFAKGLIDEGYHPMTMYFPLVVHGALLVEPTETESKASLDAFAESCIALADRARNDPESLKQAPLMAPRRRLDETRAARQPVLRWTPPAGD
ncbi:aminomethyl-transferring glycine dehydrogenase subunit GcvPB [Roseospirillum parvum]|uniref:glycine dehydrogenase (aminomethyl-transferring) n=1 Tax=Roseospirillum parvum TaxID=83401 RepID=A0A1G8FII4_9PROT|nr:aminomethyl-transferring glycine dehydrogenase subunit GcvPB [Roseospirillum parvum]SDH81866.1 glycine dehydrogenase subunit 2 [Roseospirillum parvum]